VIADGGWKREHDHANINPSRKAMHCTNCEEVGEMEYIASGHDKATCGRKGGDMGGYIHRECTEKKQSAINNLHYSKEKHKFEEAQRGGARKAKTAHTKDDEDSVNTRSANTEDSSPMEGFAREGEGTDAALVRYFGISSMQR
jgi:hypothetical protein